jgi:hypothetical protein
MRLPETMGGEKESKTKIVLIKKNEIHWINCMGGEEGAEARLKWIEDSAGGDEVEMADRSERRL